MKPQQLGPYRLTRRLGAGGMATVYEAVHAELNVKRAVKVLASTDDPDLVLRFQREGQAQAAVDRHPHVVRVHGQGHDQGRSYLVLDLVTGGTLRDRLEQGALDPHEAAVLVGQLAEGLAHVHAHGILHRDLKPENVLFDAEGRPKLADFGLAAMADAGALTRTGELLGTPAYMAPEQALANHEEVDERTDVYALGAVLFHALTGRPPFPGKLLPTLLFQVARGGAPSARSVNPSVPHDLDGVCSRALSHDPSQRYPSASALAADLEAIGRGEALTPGEGTAPKAAWFVPPTLLLLSALMLWGAWRLLADAVPTPPPPTVPPPAPRATTELEQARSEFAAAERGSADERHAVQRIARAICADRKTLRLRLESLQTELNWSAGSPLRQASLRLWSAHALAQSHPPTATACLGPLRSAGTVQLMLTSVSSELSEPQLDVVATLGLAYPKLWPALREVLEPDPELEVTRERALRELTFAWFADVPGGRGPYLARVQRICEGDPLVTLLNLQHAARRGEADYSEILRECLRSYDWNEAPPEVLRLAARANARLGNREEQFAFRRRANVKEMGPLIGNSLSDFVEDLARSFLLGESEGGDYVAAHASLLSEAPPATLLDVRVEMGFFFWSNDTAGQAAEDLRALLHEWPGHPRALRVAGVVAMREKDTQTRYDCFRDIVLLAPRPLLLLRLRRLERIIRDVL